MPGAPPPGYAPNAKKITSKQKKKMISGQLSYGPHLRRGMISSTSSQVGHHPTTSCLSQRRALNPGGRELRDEASCELRRHGQRGGRPTSVCTWWWWRTSSSAHRSGGSLGIWTSCGTSGRVDGSLHELGAATASMKPARAEQAHQEDAQPWRSRPRAASGCGGLWCFLMRWHGKPLAPGIHCRAYDL